MSDSTSRTTPNTPEPTQRSKLSPTLAPTFPTPLKPIASWRFWAVMLIQSVLIAAVPFQSALTYVNGQTVTLQTAPVDPYDLLRGYSQTLSYDIANIDTLKSLTGADDVFGEKGESRPGRLFVTLQAPSEEATESPVPQAWEPVAVSLEYPDSLQENQVALEGNSALGWRVEYGLETYYMPESQRNDINDHIREVQQSEEQAFVVDVKVDSKGNSVPVSLWVSDREYRF